MGVSSDLFLQTAKDLTLLQKKKLSFIQFLYVLVSNQAIYANQG